MLICITGELDFSKLPQGLWDKKEISISWAFAHLQKANFIHTDAETANLIADDFNIAKVTIYNNGDIMKNVIFGINSGVKILVWNEGWNIYTYYRNIGDALQGKLDYIEGFCEDLNQRVY